MAPHKVWKSIGCFFHYAAFVYLRMLLKEDRKADYPHMLTIYNEVVDDVIQKEKDANITNQTSADAGFQDENAAIITNPPYPAVIESDVGQNVSRAEVTVENECAAGASCKSPNPNVFGPHKCYGCKKKIHSHILCGKTVEAFLSEYPNLVGRKFPSGDLIDIDDNNETRTVCFTCITQILSSSIAAGIPNENYSRAEDFIALIEKLFPTNPTVHQQFLQIMKFIQTQKPSPDFKALVDNVAILFDDKIEQLVEGFIGFLPTHVHDKARAQLESHIALQCAKKTTDAELISVVTDEKECLKLGDQINYWLQIDVHGDPSTMRTAIVI